MTLIVGWKNNNTVYIAGDSAITDPNKSEMNPDTQTSFTEAIVNEPKQVLDTALKVEILQNKLLVASAGNDYLCRNFIKDLYHKIKTVDSEIITVINDTITEYNHTRDCGFIFGFVRDGKPCLFSYNDSVRNLTELKEVANFTYAGSIDETVIKIIQSITTLIKKSNFDDSKTMVSLCAILQSFVLRHPQMERGVGGFFAGAYINNHGIRWLDDTTYLIYNKGFPTENSGINISVALRDNGAFVYTPQSGVHNKILLNTHSENPKEEAQKWLDKHYEETNKKVNTSDSKYIAFLHSTRPIVGILSADYSKYVKVLSIDTLRREVVLTGEWLNKLFSYAVPKGLDRDEVYPFTFYYGWY